MEIVFFLVAILIVGIILFAITTMIRGGSKQLDVTKYRSQWLSIEQKMVRDNEESHQIAVLNADKLLDRALKELNIKGETMGERMKSTQWSNTDAVWAAHKLRNRIAHESDVKVDYVTARRALASFKQGLKDVGAI